MLKFIIVYFRLIPLPEEFMLSRDHTDDPSLHEGRIRSFPHERGNWASMVFIPCKYFEWSFT